jgi:hypothetical protein
MQDVHSHHLLIWVDVDLSELQRSATVVVEEDVHTPREWELVFIRRRCVRALEGRSATLQGCGLRIGPVAETGEASWAASCPSSDFDANSDVAVTFCSTILLLTLGCASLADQDRRNRAEPSRSSCQAASCSTNGRHRSQRRLDWGKTGCRGRPVLDEMLGRACCCWITSGRSSAPRSTLRRRSLSRSARSGQWPTPVPRPVRGTPAKAEARSSF